MSPVLSWNPIQVKSGAEPSAGRYFLSYAVTRSSKQGLAKRSYSVPEVWELFHQALI